METQAKKYDPEAARREYEAQAQAFLDRFGLTLKAELRTPETCPAWSGDGTHRAKDSNTCPQCGTVHGREYLVTLAGKPRTEADAERWRVRPALSFPYWGAHADRPNLDAPAMSAARRGKHPSAYDVLACISSDASSEETPDEVYREFGPMPPSQAQEIADHAKRLRQFFTEAEREALAEIQ